MDDSDVQPPDARLLIRPLADRMESGEISSRSDLAEAIGRGLDAAFPDGPRFVSRAEADATRRLLYRLIGAAARSHRSEGWTTQGGQLATHPASGHWGHIVFAANGRHSPQLVSLFAGTLSPFLMRVWNDADPDKPRRFVASHVTLLWRNEGFLFNEDVLVDPRPFDLSERFSTKAEPVLLGGSTAGNWLADLLGRLMPLVEALCTDLAMRDWLLENDGANTGSLRMAALLTRHLGQADELAHVLDLAEIAHQSHKARMLSLDPPIQVERDRSRFPGDWSHRRFVEYVDSIET